MHSRFPLMLQRDSVRISLDKHEMERFTMRECGECYVFDDDRIWHMLTPVAVLEGNQYAYRDTLAFDMLPEGWEPVKGSTEPRRRTGAPRPPIAETGR